MSRKVYLNLEVSMILTVDEGVDVSYVLDEMDYYFSDTTGGATIEDISIGDFEITDSKCGKIYLNLEVGMILTVDEGVDVSDVIDEMYYDFSDTSDSATIEHTSIESFEITDSK